MKKISIILSSIALLFPAALNAQLKESADTTLSLPWQQTGSFWQNATGAVSINLSDVEKSPAYDIRNQLTGLVTGLEVRESEGGIMPTGNYTSSSLTSNQLTLVSKGTGMAVIIDDALVPFNQLQLDVNQIESLTLLTSATAKALYGPRASNGALYIKTKKGSYNTPLKVSLDMRTALDIEDRFPEWVNGYEYAVLNNQARENDGYTALYSDEALAGYKKGDMYSRTYPSVDYRSLMIKKTRPSSSFGFSMNGGNSTVKFNASLGGRRAEDAYAVGPVSAFSKITMSSSVTAKIGKWIEANVSFNGYTGFRNYNKGSITSFRSVPAIAFPVALGVSTNDSDVDGISAGNTIYAVSRTYTSNPYAQMVDGGYSTRRMRSGMFTGTFDFDFGWLLPGLKSKTFVEANNYYYITVGKTNDYLAYYWDADSDIGSISSHVGTKQASKSSTGTESYIGFNAYERLYYDWAKAGHKLNVGATFFVSKASHSDSNYYEKQAYLVGNASYSYNGKYFAEAALQYAGSSRFAKGNRYGLFPSLAASWLASKEDFLKNSSVVDNLKLRADVGYLSDVDIFGSNYLYTSNYTLGDGDTYGPATAYQWFGSDKQSVASTTITRLQNHDLRWPRTLNVDLGVDAELLGCLSISADFFVRDYTGIIVDVTDELPALSGLSSIAYYDNYNRNRAVGLDLGIRWTRRMGDWQLSLGANATTDKTTRIKYAGDIYVYDWTRIEGSASDAYRGFICLGRFTSDEEIAQSSLYSTDTKVGDLKYKDLNEDGVIDANDKTVIGHTAPRLRYALNMDLKWKNFSLFVVGSGRAFMDVPYTSEYFWNGWGDSNYSKFVLENLGGDYPRLGYDKSANNFVASDFWLHKGGYFKLQTLEVAYTLPLKSKAIKDVKFSLRGSNLFTLTGVKYIDPEDVDAGVTVNPLYRTVSAGVKFNF